MPRRLPSTAAMTKPNSTFSFLPLPLPLPLPPMAVLPKLKPWRLLRGAKTIFFLLTMSLSLLLFSGPVLPLLLADALLPAALYALISPSPNLKRYDFRHSVVDVPLVSMARSVVILLAYYACDGPGLSRWPYLVVVTVCCLLSAAAVSAKTWLFWVGQAAVWGGERWEVAGLFLCSVVMAVAHVVVAYRTSCRERRKLLVYKIDIEAVCVNFPVLLFNQCVGFCGEKK